MHRDRHHGNTWTTQRGHWEDSSDDETPPATTKTQDEDKSKDKRKAKGIHLQATPTKETALKKADQQADNNIGKAYLHRLWKQMKLEREQKKQRESERKSFGNKNHKRKLTSIDVDEESASQRRRQRTSNTNRDTTFGRLVAPSPWRVIEAHQTRHNDEDSKPGEVSTGETSPGLNLTE
jgi:hypothetical protein